MGKLWIRCRRPNVSAGVDRRGGERAPRADQAGKKENVGLVYLGGEEEVGEWEDNQRPTSAAKPLNLQKRNTWN